MLKMISSFKENQEDIFFKKKQISISECSSSTSTGKIIEDSTWRDSTLVFSWDTNHFPYFQHTMFFLKLLIHCWLCLIKGNLGRNACVFHFKAYLYI